MENNKHINTAIVKNCLEYKDLSFKFRVIIDKKSNLFNSGSSTIIKQPSSEFCYIMNVRCINYSFYEGSKYNEIKEKKSL